MVVSVNEANKALLSYLDIFRDAILEANEEQKTALTPESRAKIPKRGISTIMNALVTHRLRANLTGLQGVEIKEKYAQTQITFSHNFLMKCKQSRYRRISFIETQLMLGFMNQLQTMFPRMPSPITNIVLTYQWNRTRTEIEKISILCPADEHSNYHWEIDVPLEGGHQTIPNIQPQQPPVLPVETKRIIPKAKKVQKSKDGAVRKYEQQRKEDKS